VRRIGVYAAIAAVVIAVTGAGFSAIFDGPGGRHAVVVSAVTALVVQVAAFAVAWRLRGWNFLGAWGLGAAIRFVAIVVYAFVGLRIWSLDPTPALLSLVTFFFLSTLAEPWLLRSPVPSP